MKCENCDYCKKLDKKELRSRCTLVAPFSDKKDKRRIAMVMPSDGCEAGQRKTEQTK